MSKFRTKNLGGEKSFRISRLLTVTVVDTWRGPRPGEIVFDTYAWDEIKKFVLEEEGYREPRPEPKPWHEAVNNELWLLQIDGCFGPEVYRFGFDHRRGDAFRPVNSPDRVRFDATDKAIISGRRIWPEGD